MRFAIYNIRYTIYITLLVFFIPLGIFASTTSGTIDSTYKYAWSDQGGWINFGCASCAVQITDTAITGYAWSENFGWINFNPDGEGGVSNTSEGVLSGSAWGQNVGWVNFAGATINSNGEFAGTAVDNYLGNINFKCLDANDANCANWGVKTDWRPASARTSGTTASAGGGGGGNLLYPPAGGFKVSINDGAGVTNKLPVIINLFGGPNVARVQISNTFDFKDTSEAYESAKMWVLPAGDGQKTVYVRFLDATGNASQILSASIILDTTAPDIKITSAKDFNSSEDIILVGTVNKKSQIFLNYNQQYGLINADSGAWSVNLGKMSVGNYTIQLKAEDIAGNSKLINFTINVKERQVSSNSILEPIINILKPKPPKPKEIIKIPTIPPKPLAGNWNVLPEKAIKSFVMAPLPGDIKSLAQKFPKLAQTLNNVGISKMNNVSALQNTSLVMPGLAEVVKPPETEVVPGKFAVPPALPIKNFTLAEKNKIPTDVVFARTSNGLVDVKALLSVDSQGLASQKINVTAGAPLELLVKTDAPAKSVKAYFVFKSRNTQTASLASKNNFAAALISSVFAQTSQGAPEQKLVLAEADFKNSGDNVYTATVQTPVVSGEYEIITVINYQDIKLGNKEIRLVSVVDPEGYVFEKNGDKETRVNGAVVSLYWLNPETKQYQLWPSADYQQENPQITNATGTYSFLVPDGYYYIKVSAPGYGDYDGKAFQVAEGSGIHINVEMKTKYWWLAFLDWKSILLVCVVLLLIYNFYKDKVRNATLNLAKS